MLYRGGVNTGCGSASSAVGPFYCPADQRVYVDLSFYNDMTQQLGASGDFAWAHTVYEAGDLEEGDVEEAVGASEAVGDDRLQGRAPGGINPDSFTHGTSEQRARWFNKGRERGEPGDCDTFSVDSV